MLHGPGDGRDRAWKTRGFWLDLGLLAWAGIGVALAIGIFVKAVLEGAL